MEILLWKLLPSKQTVCIKNFRSFNTLFSNFVVPAIVNEELKLSGEREKVFRTGWFGADRVNSKCPEKVRQESTDVLVTTYDLCRQDKT